ncbi:hypothetical protein PVAP13_4NG314964 [Panicum virgatum]|uniref:Uncharacterized protein n=1 Tax=Panicum virgatum TaxID=38727 RepID=A0A8T0TGS9_PANVG|nr:hypothetical protein PVAP13_4NG314964 [Panicum virgatum]
MLCSRILQIERSSGHPLRSRRPHLSSSASPSLWICAGRSRPASAVPELHRPQVAREAATAPATTQRSSPASWRRRTSSASQGREARDAGLRTWIRLCSSLSRPRATLRPPARGLTPTPTPSETM